MTAPGALVHEICERLRNLQAETLMPQPVRVAVTEATYQLILKDADRRTLRPMEDDPSGWTMLGVPITVADGVDGEHYRIIVEEPAGRA